MSSSFDSVEDKSINIEELALFPSQKCTNNQTLVVTEYAVFFFVPLSHGIFFLCVNESTCFIVDDIGS